MAPDCFISGLSGIQYILRSPAHLSVDNPEGSQGGMTPVEVSGLEEVEMTSPVRQEELSAAIVSILSDTEQSVQ